MIQAISQLAPYIDPEYLRIIQELRSLGLTPSGNKAVDAGRLAQAKAELVTKIKEKERAESNQSLQLQTIDPTDAAEKNTKAELEEQRLGAMTIAELNRLYHNI